MALDISLNLKIMPVKKFLESNKFINFYKMKKNTLNLKEILDLSSYKFLHPKFKGNSNDTLNTL